MRHGYQNFARAARPGEVFLTNSAYPSLPSTWRTLRRSAFAYDRDGRHMPNDYAYYVKADEILSEVAAEVAKGRLRVAANLAALLADAGYAVHRVTALLT